MREIDWAEALAVIGTVSALIWMVWQFASAPLLDESERPITGDDFVGENMEHERDVG